MRALLVIVFVISCLAIASTAVLHVQTREASEQILLGRALDRAKSFALTVKAADVDDGVLDHLSSQLVDSSVVFARVYAPDDAAQPHERAMGREAIKNRSHVFEFEKDGQGRRLLALWYPFEMRGTDRKRNDIEPFGPGPKRKQFRILKLQMDASATDRLVNQNLIHACLITLLLVLLVALTLRQVRLAIREQALQKDLLEQQRFAEIGRLSAVLAHEVRNPLGAIKGFAQYAMESLGESDPKRADMETIVAESARLERLVKSLLLYAKPATLRVETRDLAAFASGVRELIKGDAEERHVAIALELPESPVPVSIDADQMTQALLNILSNAVKSMDSGGTLRIAVDQDETHVRLSVSDTGEGIAPEILPDIFEPYYTTRASGTGLGLAVTRRIVRSHGGEVLVESRPGQGSTFTIVLPKAGEESVG